MSYKIETIHYRDVYGNLLFEEPMIFKRLHGIGETLVMDYKEYEVTRVAVAETVQHINMKPT